MQRIGCGEAIGCGNEMEPELVKDREALAKCVRGVYMLRQHVVVCGLPQDLESFLIPFRQSLPGDSPNAQNSAHLQDGPSSDPSRQGQRLVPVLFLWDGALTTDNLRLLKSQPEVYLARIPPLSPTSLRMANVEEAFKIVFLADLRSAATTEPELVDGGVILAHGFIRSAFPKMAASCVCEIIESDNISFLHKQGEGEGGGGFEAGDCMSGRDPALLPAYLQGIIYSSSVCTKALSQSFYDPNCLPIVSALLSAHISNTSSLANVGHLRLLQAPVPPALQNKTYGLVLEKMLRQKDALPLGLYRLHDNAQFRFTMTNPNFQTVVRSDDRIFYLLRVARKS